MKVIYLTKEVVTRMSNTHVILGKGRVHQLLANTSVRWFNRYLPLLWDEEAMESDLGSDYIVEELLDETKKELRRWEHHLGFDKEDLLGYTE